MGRNSNLRARAKAKLSLKGKRSVVAKRREASRWYYTAMWKLCESVRRMPSSTLDQRYKRMITHAVGAMKIERRFHALLRKANKADNSPDAANVRVPGTKGTKDKGWGKK